MSVRLLRGLWALCLIFCITPAVAEALEVSATAAVLMDADMGQVLYEKNGDRQMLIASTTKIMDGAGGAGARRAGRRYHRDAGPHGGGLLHVPEGR